MSDNSEERSDQAMDIDRMTWSVQDGSEAVTLIDGFYNNSLDNARTLLNVGLTNSSNTEATVTAWGYPGSGPTVISLPANGALVLVRVLKVTVQGVDSKSANGTWRVWGLE